MFSEVIVLDFPYTLIRSSRKTISLEIRPGGTLLVRAPRRMSEKAIRDFVASKEHWIRTKLHKYQNAPAPLTPQELENLKKQAKADFSARVSRLSQQVGVSYGRITLRAQKTRWGSCSAQGNLNFNCLLMLAPEEVRDYVVIHELCHRKQMNHSPAFWAEVARVCPDYARRRQWLKEHGPALIARLPE